MDVVLGVCHKEASYKKATCPCGAQKIGSFVNLWSKIEVCGAHWACKLCSFFLYLGVKLHVCSAWCVPQKNLLQGGLHGLAVLRKVILRISPPLSYYLLCGFVLSQNLYYLPSASIIYYTYYYCLLYTSPSPRDRG